MKNEHKHNSDVTLATTKDGQEPYVKPKSVNFDIELENYILDSSDTASLLDQDEESWD